MRVCVCSCVEMRLQNSGSIRRHRALVGGLVTFVRFAMHPVDYSANADCSGSSIEQSGVPIAGVVGPFRFRCAS